MRRLPNPFSVATGLVAAFLLAIPVHAELGGRIETVDQDSVHLHARRASSVDATHSSHTLTLPNGGIVREYANADGVVFAVAWSGPGRPDLRQLLGDAHFGQFQSEAGVRRGRLMQRHVSVSQPEMVVRSSGHPGMFRGIAYVPALVPQGFSPDALS